MGGSSQSCSVPRQQNAQSKQSLAAQKPALSRVGATSQAKLASHKSAPRIERENPNCSQFTTQTMARTAAGKSRLTNSSIEHSKDRSGLPYSGTLKGSRSMNQVGPGYQSQGYGSSKTSLKRPGGASAANQMLQSFTQKHQMMPSQSNSRLHEHTAGYSSQPAMSALGKRAGKSAAAFQTKQTKNQQQLILVGSK